MKRLAAYHARGRFHTKPTIYRLFHSSTCTYDGSFSMLFFSSRFIHCLIVCQVIPFFLIIVWFTLVAPAMPGLRSQDHGLPNSIGHETHQQTQTTSTAPPTSAKLLPSLAMMNTIEFIPSQMDALSSTTTEAARKSPLRLLIQDLVVLITKLPYLTWIIRPFQTSDPNAEMYLSLRGLRDMALQSCLFILETAVILFALPAFLILPGAMFIGVATIIFTLIYIVAWPMHGSKLVYSHMDESTIAKAQQHENERWIFINGCMTT